MRETRRNLLVGLFVLAGLGALGALVVLFGEDPTAFSGRDRYTLIARFQVATGIRPGTLVTVGGITVARVLNVEFRDRARFDAGINVALVFEAGYQIPEGAIARTTEPGLGMGRPPIVLELPSDADAPMLASGSTIPGELVPAMEALFPSSVRVNFENTAMQIGRAAAALTPVLEDMHVLLQQFDLTLVDQPGGPQGNLATAMTRLDGALKHFNDVLGDPNVQSQLRGAVADLGATSADARLAAADLRAVAAQSRQVATDAQALLVRAEGTLDNLDENVREVAVGSTRALNQASEALTEVTRLGQRVNAGEGTIGKLLTDDRLFESMVLTFRRLAETAEEFRLLIKEWQKGRIRVAL